MTIHNSLCKCSKRQFIHTAICLLAIIIIIIIIIIILLLLLLFNNIYY